MLHVTEERSSDLLHGLSGTPVLLADDEDDALHESKCMVEHEGFHLAVDPAAPEGPLEERPSDLDLGFSLLEVTVSGAPDDTAGRAVDYGEGSARLDRALEVLLENLGLVPIALGVQLPDQRILCVGVMVPPG